MSGAVLNEILTLDIYRFFMVFARIGAALMLFPGFGATMVSTRIRLILALALSLVLLPIVGPLYPNLPRHLGGLTLLIFGEVAVGIFLGVLTQVVMSAMNVAGTFIGFQIGLTNAFSYDVVAEQQSSTLSAFLANVALVALFTTDLHHLLIRALTDSYATFVPGQLLPLGDFAETLSHLLSESFGMGIRLAAPLLVYGLIFYAGLGLLSRLAPQIQVFFVALPLQVFSGLWMLMVALPVMIIVFLRFFEDSLIPFVAR
jgi:flagellar biosynthetic protein FliR